MVKSPTPDDEHTEERQQETKTNTGSVRTIPPNASHPPTYVRAFAARIGERDLWIANSGAVQPDNLEKLNLEPEHVISLNRTPTGATTDYYPLKDGYLNDQKAFREAVEIARERYQQCGQTIVNCAAGISRSATIIATTIAAEEGVSFDDAVAEIKKTREKADPHPKLQLSAQIYLATDGGESGSRQRVKELVDQVSSNKKDEDKIEDLLTVDGVDLRGVNE